MLLCGDSSHIQGYSPPVLSGQNVGIWWIPPGECPLWLVGLRPCPLLPACVHLCCHLPVLFEPWWTVAQRFGIVDSTCVSHVVPRLPNSISSLASVWGMDWWSQIGPILRPPLVWCGSGLGFSGYFRLHKIRIVVYLLSCCAVSRCGQTRLRPPGPLLLTSPRKLQGPLVWRYAYLKLGLIFCWWGLSPG